MKISKLFHWLYALLMLLPAFFVGGRMAYTIFNKNAYESYSDTLQSQQNILSNYNEFIEGNNYEIVYKEYTTSIYNYSPWIKYTNISINWTDYGANNSLTFNTFRIRTSDNLIQLKTDDGSSTDNLFNVWGNSLMNFTFTFKSSDAYNNMQLIDNNTILYYTYINNTLDNAFDYSMSQLNELPLFSWAKDSFIVQPFTYITALFGMPSDSPVLTLLSYWCSISLIWLTFDLLMYVPLLVHRWLDKGVLE